MIHQDPHEDVGGAPALLVPESPADLDAPLWVKGERVETFDALAVWS